MNNIVNFNSLPRDVVKIIFDYLDIRSLTQAEKVCTSWKRLASCDQLWKKFSVHDTPAPNKSCAVTAIKIERHLISCYQQSRHDLPKLWNLDLYQVLRDTNNWHKAMKYTSWFDTPITCATDMSDGFRYLRICAKAFDAQIRLTKLGLSSLTEAEKIAIISVHTLKNPAPLEILAKLYSQAKMPEKEEEMKRGVITCLRSYGF